MTPRTALGALHIGALMFGLTGVFGKLAAASPAVIVFGRAVFAVLALAMFARFASNSRWQKLRAQDSRRLLLGGLLLAGHWVSFFIAVKVAGVAVATLGFTSFPAFTVLLEGLIFRERIRANEIWLVVLVSVGLVLVTPNFDLASGATTGLLWAVFSGLLFSLLSLTNRAGSAHVPPVQAALCQNVVVGLCLLPLAAPQLSDVRPIDWLWIGLLGVFCTGLAHSLFVASLAVIKARTAAVVFAMEPVYGIAMAWWLFDESPTLRMLLGGVVIITAIVISSQLSGSKKPGVGAQAASH
ncbi:EamA family transporter [Pseudomonas ogarae]|uniref:DMT family transporter n=1 Tax=Pseudomonas ogarae (strain DSM 112162 / CECT 30235 / F113) TaxID=1114970 RepID=UPI0009A34209|nr:DMT family transporter [Pseudomonas ogarae]OPG69181.1 EamA family transporter [Pseudomonas ogarae]OPG76046.1 EamA family transporter [Pseudomonas ogarae]PBJ15433.1 putative inner membrane transporter yiJE [Pseudomonas ogarae]PBJ16785.1 putative inner membrane transporter yiJE [Pseudomonas ogarae]